MWINKIKYINLNDTIIFITIYFQKMDLENIQEQNQDLKNQIKTLKIKNIEIIQNNHENLQQNL